MSCIVCPSCLPVMSCPSCRWPSLTFIVSERSLGAAYWVTAQFGCTAPLRRKQAVRPKSKLGRSFRPRSVPMKRKKPRLRPSAPAPQLGGSGNRNYVAKFTNRTTLGDSQIFGIFRHRRHRKPAACPRHGESRWNVVCRARLLG
jgi:hypothetical protein